MNDLYLKADGRLKFNLAKDRRGEYFSFHFADIFYSTEDNDKGTKIGFIQVFYYHQALAMANGISMYEVPYIALKLGFKALKELDYTLITAETINEIGEATNPNILVISRIGISAKYRNKGIGEQLLKGFVRKLKGKCGYVVILHGTPAQCIDREENTIYENRGVELAGLEKDPEKAQWKLNAFFQRCGFRLFKNFDNVFICNVDQAVPDPVRVIKTEK
jgi:GNAT superfamily N-acetyltransferase